MEPYKLLAHNSGERVALLAIFVALGAVFKISLAAIPNVELLTFWVFVVTMVYGPVTGSIVGIFANATADLYIGAGPWTPFICAAFGLVAVIVHLYKKAGLRSPREYLLCGILVTLAFDLFTVVTASWLVLGIPLLAALYAQYGIIPPTFYPFGFIHIAANAVLFSALGAKIIGIIRNVS
jgi:uncharacterized membrane protein